MALGLGVRLHADQLADDGAALLAAAREDPVGGRGALVPHHRGRHDDDAVTGELMWVHSEREGARGAAAPRQLAVRLAET